MYKQVGNLNPYALDYPVCTEDSPRKQGRGQRAWLINNQLNALHTQYEGVTEQHVKTLRSALKLQPVDGYVLSWPFILSIPHSFVLLLLLRNLRYEPCEEDYLTSYLNQTSVKAALHVKEDIDWKDCSYTLRYDQKDGSKTMTEYYNYLIDNKFGLNILVFSGDDDDVCATVGTQSWIWDLGYTAAKSQTWQQYIVNGQTAGYLTQWEGTKLAFATVHGAGHEVPAYKPQEALWLYDNYLQGKLNI